MLAPVPAAGGEGAAGSAADAPEVIVDGEDESDNEEARVSNTARNPYAPTERERPAGPKLVSFLC